MTSFDADTVAAVISHMNGDHAEDNLLIARAYGAPAATASTMVGVDGEAGVWRVRDTRGERELRVPWPGGSITERAEIRREVVALYHGACEQLGVPPRQQHIGNHEEQHSAHHTGQRSEHHSATEQASAGDDTFSQAIRAATWGDHGDSEGATIMEDIMRMRASLADYAALTAQHFFMYEALEEAAQLLAQDERYAILHPDELLRADAIVEDLEHLLGAQWRTKIVAEPATLAYAARIREVASEGWLPGVIAHHYTRYLGDMSGGQLIAKRVATQHGFSRAGVAFYDFSELGNLDEYKQRYRAVLDQLGEELDAAERARVIEEIKGAYRFNTEVFIDMQNSREARS